MDPTRLNRLRWRCRRGMLENDLILARFLDARGAAMTEAEVAALDRLLDLTDNDLWDLLVGPRRARTRIAPLLRRCAPRDGALQTSQRRAGDDAAGDEPKRGRGDRAAGRTEHQHGATCMTDRTATLTFSDGSPSVDVPDPRRHRSGPDVIDIRTLYGKTGKFTYDPGFLSTAVVQLGDHLHRRRQGRAALPRLPDRGARGATATSSRSATCCSTASCRTPTQKKEFVGRVTTHTMVQRADAVLPARLPPRRAPDGGAGRAGRRAVARSTTTRSTCTTRSSATSRRSA